MAVLHSKNTTMAAKAIELDRETPRLRKNLLILKRAIEAIAAGDAAIPPEFITKLSVAAGFSAKADERIQSPGELILAARNAAAKAWKRRIAEISGPALAIAGVRPLPAGFSANDEETKRLAREYARLVDEVRKLRLVIGRIVAVGNEEPTTPLPKRLPKNEEAIISKGWKLAMTERKAAVKIILAKPKPTETERTEKRTAAKTTAKT
jgi:hypothetical protein